MGEGIHLIRHARGGYYVKYKGKLVSLGCKNDPKRAREVAAQKIADYSRNMPVIRTGPAGEITIGQLVNRYCRERRKDRDAGNIAASTCDDYEDAARRLVESVGRDTRVADLIPQHFTNLYRALARRLGAHSIAKNVQCIRTMFNQSYDNAWIEAKPRFGVTFKKPITPRREHTISAEEWCKCYLNADGQMLAMVLLALNCAYTPKDLAALPRAVVDLKHGMIVWPRPKMARRNPIQRAATLWPETVSVLDEVMKHRPNDALVFRTIWGNPWVRSAVSAKGKHYDMDSINPEFAKVCAIAGIPKRGFAAIRHLFSTIADEAESPNAKARVMGHKLGGMDSIYVDHIEHQRLRRVTDHVRSKVLACPLPPQPPKPHGAHP